MTEKQHTGIDEQQLRELYQQKKLSMDKVADRLDVTKSKVRYWMEKYSIERRTKSEANSVRYGAPQMRTDHHGYEVFKHCFKQNHTTLSHHRLLAVAHYGFDAVCSKDIHHKNEIPWDNRIENFEILSRSEHSKEHKDATPTHKKLAMWAMHETGEYTYNDIGNVLKENSSNVGTFIAEVRNNEIEG